MQDLADFLEPVLISDWSNDEGYTDGQMGKQLRIFETELPDLEGIDIVLLGINENRGSGFINSNSRPADVIRKQFYSLHYWHNDVHIADLGNVRPGASLKDSHAAIKTVVAELLRMEKTVVIFGGSHDLTLAQYEAYRELKEQIEVTCIDSKIDLRGESPVRSENFLMEMLTAEPNIIRHYNHLAFQSYFVHPRMLETMDKLRFDCYRIGMVSENIEEIEPVFRNTNLLSFDINAIKYCDAPANKDCPNGLTGVEACMLTRYAGMSHELTSMGIYGYSPENDEHDLTAKQISQMLWYFVDGKSRSKQEAALEDRNYFNEYHTAFAEVDTVFIQSKRTSRWWMQMPDNKFIACSYNDYVKASQNLIPERWLRVQERS